LKPKNRGWNVETKKAKVKSEIIRTVYRRTLDSKISVGRNRVTLNEATTG